MYSIHIQGLLANTGNGGDPIANLNSNSLWSSVVILILFIGVLFAAYYVTRFIGRFQMGQTRQRNMQIVEAISVGQGKTIQLVKVGDRFILVGVTKDQITFLSEVDEEGLNLEQLKTSFEGGQNFNRYLSQMMQKKRQKNQKDNNRDL